MDNHSRDPETGAYWKAGRPFQINSVIQDDQSAFPESSSRLLGSQVFTSYELHRHGDRWSTLPHEVTTEQFEALDHNPAFNTASKSAFTWYRTSGKRTALQTQRIFYEAGDPESRDQPTSTRTEWEDGVVQHQQFTYAPATAGPWWVGRTLTQRTWSDDGCNTDIAFAYEYDPTTGAPIRVIAQPDALSPPRSNEQREREMHTTELLYDAFGNVVRTTESTETGEVRIEQMDFDADGIFLASHTNALEHKTYFYFEPAHGQLIATVDPNGLVSNAEYDGFGRMRRINRPDGSWTRTKYSTHDGAGRLLIDQ